MLAIGAGGVCAAAELSVNPSINFREEYNDNIRLTSAPHKSVFATTISPAVRFTRRTDTNEMSGKAQLNLNRYRGDSQLNANDVLIDLSFLQKLERDLLTLDGGFTRDSTFASELAGTGVVQARRQRTRAGFSPAWTKTLNERASLKFGYDFADVRYEDRQNTSLFNYRTEALAPTLKYKASERDDVFTTIGYSEYRAPDAGAKFKTVFVEGGFERKFSEVLVGRASVGVNRVRARLPQGEDSRNGWLTNLGLERRFETSSLSAQASRQLNPSGAGLLTETTRFALDWSQKLNPRAGYGLSASWYRNTFLDPLSTNRAERYYRLGARMNWLLTEYWSLEAGFGHERSEREGAENATANSVFVSAQYNWPKISVQR
jgi:hypothetical protein